MSGVYSSTQSPVTMKSLGRQSARQPSARRIGSQWDVTISGGSLSEAAKRRVKWGEELRWAAVGIVPGANPRRLALTRWTEL